jgi:hypothetical protein
MDSQPQQAAGGGDAFYVIHEATMQRLVRGTSRNARTLLTVLMTCALALMLVATCDLHRLHTARASPCAVAVHNLITGRDPMAPDQRRRGDRPLLWRAPAANGSTNDNSSYIGDIIRLHIETDEWRFLRSAVLDALIEESERAQGGQNREASTLPSASTLLTAAGPGGPQAAGQTLDAREPREPREPPSARAMETGPTAAGTGAGTGAAEPTADAPANPESEHPEAHLYADLAEPWWWIDVLANFIPGLTVAKRDPFGLADIVLAQAPQWLRVGAGLEPPPPTSGTGRGNRQRSASGSESEQPGPGVQPDSRAQGVAEDHGNDNDGAGVVDDDDGDVENGDETSSANPPLNRPETLISPGDLPVQITRAEAERRVDEAVSHHLDDPVYFFSLERGFFFVSGNARARHGVTIANVTLRSDHACFSGLSTVYDIFGYDPVAAGIFDTLSGGRGYVYVRGSHRVITLRHLFGLTARAPAVFTTLWPPAHAILSAATIDALFEYIEERTSLLVTGLVMTYVALRVARYVFASIHALALRFSISTAYYIRARMPHMIIPVLARELAGAAVAAYGTALVIGQISDQVVLAATVLLLGCFAELFLALYGRAPVTRDYFARFIWLGATAFHVFVFAFPVGFHDMAVACLIMYTALCMWAFLSIVELDAWRAGVVSAARPRHVRREAGLHIARGVIVGGPFGGPPRVRVAHNHQAHANQNRNPVQNQNQNQHQNQNQPAGGGGAP